MCVDTACAAQDAAVKRSAASASLAEKVGAKALRPSFLSLGRPVYAIFENILKKLKIAIFSEEFANLSLIISCNNK